MSATLSARAGHRIAPCPARGGRPLSARALAVLDDALDLTVVGGYTSIGYWVRRHWWTDDDLPAMDGKTVLVTGGSAGIGLAAGEGFARLGASVWLAVRDRARGERARARILERAPSADIRIGTCDLASLSSVREFAHTFADQAPRLDVLVNNAGVLAEERERSPDGIELTFATNVVGPFLLTNLLIPPLERSAPARIVNVSSGGMYTQRIRSEDVESEQADFDGPRAYARSKRAEVILTQLWAQRLAGTGVVVHAMHPGWVDTGGLRKSLPRFYSATRPLLRTPAQGADTIVWLGASAEAAAGSGGFWHDRRRRATHLVPGTRETETERERLWAQCVALSGWSEPEVQSAALSRCSAGSDRQAN